LLASPGFDAAVWEIWPYLAAGASLYVVDEAVRTAPAALRDWIVRTGITISFLPTVLAESMVGLQWPPDGQFRVLLTGADTLRRYPPRDLPFALINNYGPTECTVVATSGKICPKESSEEGSEQSLDKRSNKLPSIGGPIDGVSVYVVDEHLQRVPNGTPGELLIGGRGVGRGYLNAPELTAEKFLPDLFGGDPDARLYRTGDLGRLLPDGQIAFMGRLDDQIKVMGHRIEPNEIVTVLNRHPEIEASFVCAYTDPSGDQRLVAYVVTTKDVRPKPGDLRSYLGSYLPSHMLPSAFVPLNSLPLSLHGKLDRSALPQPTNENILRDDSVEAPQSPIEEHLGVVLSGLLGVARVGSEDNFFTLGGHSLMGAQLIAKIRENFGVELSLRCLFDEPTPRGMSIEIERLIHARLAAMSEDEAQRLLASSG
jgi:acyl-CoA synthetase (AMP-forming)/AMP-acid ligase II